MKQARYWGRWAWVLARGCTMRSLSGLSLSVLAGSLPGWKLEQEAAEMVWKLIFPSSENCAANQEKHRRCTGFLMWAGLQRWNCILSLCLFLACCCQTYAKAITAGEGHQEFSVTENLTALLRRACTARQSSLRRHCRWKKKQILAFLLPVLFVFNEKHVWALFFNYSTSHPAEKPGLLQAPQHKPCPALVCPDSSVLSSAGWSGAEQAAGAFQSSPLRWALYSHTFWGGWCKTETS